MIIHHRETARTDREDLRELLDALHRFCVRRINPRVERVVCGSDSATWKGPTWRLMAVFISMAV
jgi:hypothetical protein